MFRLSVLLVGLMLAGCSTSPGVMLKDLEGGGHDPLLVSGNDVHVIVVTSHECPIANAYAPTLRELHRTWANEPRVHFFLAHVDPDIEVAAAKAHAKDYELPGTILMDPGQVLATACGATLTPEAIVLTSAGVAYCGRINDQWRKLGSRAPEASHHDLADAVANVLQGKPVAQPFPKAVGCLLPEPRR